MAFTCVQAVYAIQNRHFSKREIQPWLEQYTHIQGSAIEEDRFRIRAYGLSNASHHLMGILP